MDGLEDLSSADSATDRMARWLLLSGDRFAVTAVLTLGVFGLFVVLGALGIVTLAPGRMQWFLNGTINGLLTLIPIAVGVNQIVLSQELDSLEDLHERTKGAYGFRHRVEDTIGIAVSSPQASSFCNDIFTSINDHATELGEICDDSTDEQLDDVDDYVRTLAEQTDEASSALDDVGFGLFDALLILLDYNNTWQMYTMYHLRATYDDALPEAAKSQFEELEELFLELDTTRDYLKTLWVQRELAEFSRVLLYSGIPAILVAAVGIFGYRNVEDVLLSDPVVVFLVSTIVTISLLPLWLLVSYLGRIALVVQRTAAFGPFVSRSERQRISEQVETNSEESDTE